MDETTEAFFTIIFWLLVGPFWLAGKLIAAIWNSFAKPAIERKNDEAAEAQAKKQIEDSPARKERNYAREQQLTALRVAAPTGPPERMRATIQLNTIKTPRYEKKRVRHLIGEDSFVSVEAGEYTQYTVDMILELSETERAIIRQHDLDDIVLEESPVFTEQQLIRMRIENREEVRATKDLLLKEVKRRSFESQNEILKDERQCTRVGDLLVAPFSKVFDSPHDAKKYADKLKNEYLPTLRQLIDNYRGHKQTETLEF